MAKKPLCIAILWHMHQPDYGNVDMRAICLPWTRFHAIKDYYDMAALVTECPGLHVTFNVVPSMIDQIEAYAQELTHETYASLALRNAADLDERERLFLLRSFFQLPWKRMIIPYPRYKELLDKRGKPDSQGRFSLGLRRFSTQDYRDLQLWFNLSWCGNELRRDARIAELFHKGRDFTETDKADLLELQRAFIGRILPIYRRLADEYGVEISVSPYYHAILPLVIDIGSAREATPDIVLPPASFSCPGDAREQIHRAQSRYREVFGRDPLGMWPSEGAISDAACGMAHDMGFRWLASDEGVLQNSLKKSGRGGALTLEQKCRAWTSGRGPALFFRDHTLSDLIGFTYSLWSAEEAVADFLQRLRRIHDALPDTGSHYVVPVILDGENAWEHYPRNGADFLGLLYRKLAESDFLRSVTFSEFLDLESHREPLETISAGSWIYSSLTTWIGHPEKNAAWQALAAAQAAFTRLEKEVADPAKRVKAYRELLVAEGSDWFWWYGDDHQTENAAEFDLLFRSHLKNVYRSLDRTYPIELDNPIKKTDIRAQYRNPVHTVTPRLDGKVTDYFEWLAAGYATPAGGGAMHQVVRYLEKVYFGYDTENFYVRLDFARGLQELPPAVSVQLRTIAPRECLMVVEHSSGSWACSTFESPVADLKGAAAGDRIMEMSIPLKALGVEGTDEVRFFIALHEKDRELERFPSTGFLDVPVAPWELDQEEWIV